MSHFSCKNLFGIFGKGCFQNSRHLILVLLRACNSAGRAVIFKGISSGGRVSPELNQLLIDGIKAFAWGSGIGIVIGIGVCIYLWRTR